MKTCLSCIKPGTLSRAISLLPVFLLFPAFLSPVIAQDDPAQVSADLQSAEPVGLADWPMLFKALNRPAAAEGRIVSFRELWDKSPDELEGPLAISGLVLRRFRREAVGQFPPLAELWVRTDDDGLVLLTMRDDSRRDDSKRLLEQATAPCRMIEARVWFLRRVRYQAEDAERIAPWLVLSTINDEGTSPAGPAGSGGDSASWMLLVWATVASAAVLRVLVNWVNRPRRKGGGQ
ncbi:MAG: hypothetical protein ACKO5E_10495 [bacterium]